MHEFVLAHCGLDGRSSHKSSLWGNLTSLLFSFQVFDMLSPVQIPIKTIWDHTHTYTQTGEEDIYTVIIDNT